MDLIKSYDELCRYMGQQISTGFIDWPFYSGELGSDSLGGTDSQVYSVLNAHYHILTMDSQEGTCETMYEPIDKAELSEPKRFTPLFRLKKRYPDLLQHVVSKIQERQRSELSALVPETTAQKLQIMCRELGLWFIDDKREHAFFNTTEMSYMKCYKMIQYCIFRMGDTKVTPPSSTQKTQLKVC